jgi:hypothetical protein
MSKYNLTDLLNEVQGGKIGTLNVSAKELIDKMDAVESSGIDVDRYDGLSADGKTHLEFHVHPEGRDEPDASFSVYDYKFGLDPTDEDNFMTEYPFSVGGKGGYALKMAQELVGAEAYRMEEEEKKKLPKEFADAEKAAAEKDAKKATGAMKEANEDYDLLKIKMEIRNQLDSFDKGIIDGDDLANAIEEIVFGRRAPGVNTDDDFEREQRMQMDMREEDAIEEGGAAMLGPFEFLKSKGIDEEMILAFLKVHAKDIVGASKDEIMDEFENFRSVNYDYVDENLKEHFGRFLKDYQ